MTTRRPVAVLTGFMGSGKSTVGRALADRLGVTFIDTDAEIERRAGRTIPAIFADDGEPAFRNIERDVVLDVLSTHDGVVALGGGAVTVPEIAAALDDQHVVYLEIGPDEGFARVRHSDRPLLASDDPAAVYAELLGGRRSAYEAVAVHVVDATQSPAQVVDTVLSGLNPSKEDPS